MYVYTGTKMRGFPYRRRLVPSIGYRQLPPLGNEGGQSVTNPAPVSMPINFVRVALLMAAGAVVWKVYESMRERRIESNLPSFPGIGPLFNVGAAIGPAYSLGPWIL
jgi:hypothetical protein